jgi:lycopene cyclase domain-containing protein
MTGSYTIGAVCAPAVVVAVELMALRTGILRRGRFWATIAITLAFQVAVDGWLTKLSAPIVLYRRAAISGVRWPWDIPVEDFGFAFAMITLTLALWEWAQRRQRATFSGQPGSPVGAGRLRTPPRHPADRPAPGVLPPGRGAVHE